MPPYVLVALAATLLASGCGGVNFGCYGVGGPDAHNGPYSESSFRSSGTEEIIARITAVCEPCAWDKAGYEAVVLAITLDDRPPQHLPLFRTGRHEYRVLLGSVDRGRHRVTVVEESRLTAASLKEQNAWHVEDVQIEQLGDADAAYQAVAHAPIVYARPDTVGRFTDVPILMWYEVEPTPAGQRFRYSVIFTNEDGGTPADRLMATWGRTTDIEYLYSVELDRGGAIVHEDMQGPKHEVLPFKGRREGRHPLIWVSTENNMVLDQGTTSVRYAPAPVPADLAGHSREKVMDENAWTYAVMTKELMREAKIVADAPPGQGTIPDPRRYVYVEGCATAGNNALAVSVNVNKTWLRSDRGVAEYRIVRDGCFRAAIPLPDGRNARDVTAVRVEAFARKDKPADTPSTFTQLNHVFSLDESFEPGPDINRWEGSATLTPGGPPLEIRFDAPR